MIKYYTDRKGNYRYILDINEFLVWTISNTMITHDLHPLQHDTYTHFKKFLLKFNKESNEWYNNDDKYVNMYQTYRLDKVPDEDIIDFLNDKCILIGLDDE